VGFYAQTEHAGADRGLRARSRRSLALLALAAVAASAVLAFALASSVGLTLTVRSSRDLLAKLDAVDARRQQASVRGPYPFGGTVLGVPGAEPVTAVVRDRALPGGEWRVQRMPDGAETWTEIRPPMPLIRPATVVGFGGDGLLRSVTVGEYRGASDMWIGTETWFLDPVPATAGP
jgi:hypothetical protein